MYLFYSQQILCARGYSDQLSGMSNSLILLVGTLASFPFGVLAYKTGRMITICKVCCCFVAVAICVLSYLMRIPDQVRLLNWVPLHMSFICVKFTIRVSPLPSYAPLLASSPWVCIHWGWSSSWSAHILSIRLVYHIFYHRFYLRFR